MAPRLDNFLDSLCVYAVSITQPAEIEPALRLLTQALEMAPGQENTRNTDPNAATIRPLRRYIAIDAEFANRTVTIDYKNTAGDEQELNNGRTEMLCSVLTISVDRHLVLSFYILHMLENPTDQTVPQVGPQTLLFRRTYAKKGSFRTSLNRCFSGPII